MANDCEPHDLERFPHSATWLVLGWQVGGEDGVGVLGADGDVAVAAQDVTKMQRRKALGGKGSAAKEDDSRAGGDARAVAVERERSGRPSAQLLVVGGACTGARVTRQTRRDCCARWLQDVTKMQRREAVTVPLIDGARPAACRVAVPHT